MKRILALGAVALCLSAAAADNIEWLETRHNFGAFDESMGPVHTTFRFVNHGAEGVSITAARASCGCTSPQYPRGVIAPGDTADIVVTYDPAGRPGRFSKYVAIDLSNDAPRTKLFIEGTVVGSAQSVATRFPAECGDVIQLTRGAVMSGEVAKGKMRTTFAEAYNRSTDSITPVVTGYPKYYEVTVSPATVPPGEQFTMIVYLHSDKCPLYGLVTDSMTIAPRAGAEGCTIPVTAIVREDFSKLTPGQRAKAPEATLESTTLDFGRIEGDSATKSVKVRNTGKSTLEIRRVYTADPGIEINVDKTSLKKGKEAIITVTAHRNALPGALLNARISVITNDPVSPVQNLRAVGELPAPN